MSLSIEKTDCSSLHFIGICGSGMSALAQYLNWQHLDISGSDRLCDAGSAQDEIKNKLEASGCRIFAQDGSGIDARTSAVVVSTAIEQDNPDISAAQSRGIPVFHRSDVLAAIVRTKAAIAVAGTSGKSTVASMIFHILNHAGKDPSLITGANLHSLAGQGIIGNAFSGSSHLLVIEADESDGSLVKYHPDISIFLNISKDHKPVDETLSMFQTLAARSETVICNNDETRLAGINAKCRFGTSTDADYHAELSWDPVSASMQRKGKTFTVAFPGKHMAMNMLASACVCSQLGIDDAVIAAAMKTYIGIERRFDRQVTKRGITVIDDYAHNPDKIRAALAAAQCISQCVIALFQPHGFGPMRFMFDELVAAFSDTLRNTDTLYLLPIYYAGGTASKDISSQDMAARLAGCNAEIFAPDNRDKALSAIAARAKHGDTIILMGARDPSLPAFAHLIASGIDSIKKEIRGHICNA